MKEACDNLCLKQNNNVALWGSKKNTGKNERFIDDTNPCDRHCYQIFLVLKMCWHDWMILYVPIV